MASKVIGSMNHSFLGLGKHAYRDDLIAFVRRAIGLVGKNGLAGDWCELSGRTGTMTMDLLIQHGLVEASQFVGVDRDRDVVKECHDSRPDARWICGSLLDILPDLPNVSVLNFDSYRECGSSELYLDLDGIRPTVARGVKKHGSFALLVNADLDSTKTRGTTAQEALAKHVRVVCSAIDEWLPRRSLDLGRILEGAESLDGTYVGPLGNHLYVYRSKSHRMVSLKLILHLPGRWSDRERSKYMPLDGTAPANIKSASRTSGDPPFPHAFGFPTKKIFSSGRR